MFFPARLEGYCGTASDVVATCPFAPYVLVHRAKTNLEPAGATLCGSHISDTTGRIYSVWSSMDLPRFVVVQRHGNLPMWPRWACPWSLPLGWNAYLWNRWTDFLRSKFCGIVQTCSGAVSQAFGTLHWRHNEHDGASNCQPHDCLLNRLFRRKSKKTSKFRVTGLCEWNSPATGSILWRHHEFAPHGLPHGPEHISETLDAFYPFEVLWNCLDL